MQDLPEIDSVQHKERCQNCEDSFEITQADADFYRTIDVPTPTWCPRCRLQRRLAWRNDRSLHQRHCDLCLKPILALYPTGTPFPVYCPACWYSDRWDPLQYGRPYDFSRSFFEQFKQLQEVVPRLALQIDNCEDCEYSNQIVDSKSCYLTTSASDSEDCYYCHRLLGAKDSVDCLLLNKSERCHQSIQIRESYQITASQQVTNSTDLLFCYNAQGSQRCFLSSNVRRGSNLLRNHQVSREEYDAAVGQVDLGSHVQLADLRAEYAKLLQETVRRPAELVNCVDCTGVALTNSARCHHCFYGSGLENCRYTLFVDDVKDSMDVNNGCCHAELMYEVSTGGVNAYNMKFSVDAWPNVRNVTYVDSCRNGCSDLFGCISLQKQQYCILNQQYTRQEYEALLPRIVEQMNSVPYVTPAGREYRYGEFFPIEHSPFAYNQSSAQEYFPLTERQVGELGCRWNDVPARARKADLRSSEVPDHIRDADEALLSKTIECLHTQDDCGQSCTKLFRVMPRELATYKERKIALPRLCPNCRHAERLAELPPYRLWHRQCMCSNSNHDHGAAGCRNEFETSYAPERPEMVYCESCYQAELV